jgi:hypothetical protein
LQGRASNLGSVARPSVICLADQSYTRMAEDCEYSPRAPNCFGGSVGMLFRVVNVLRSALSRSGGVEKSNTYLSWPNVALSEFRESSRAPTRSSGVGPPTRRSEVGLLTRRSGSVNRYSVCEVGNPEFRPLTFEVSDRPRVSWSPTKAIFDSIALGRMAESCECSPRSFQGSGWGLSRLAIVPQSAGFQGLER